MTRVAFYGRKGSFSEEGALLCFPETNIQFVPCGKSIDEVFSKVNNGEVDYGVVPVENSSAGIVNETYDLLLEEKAFVVREAVLPIRQHLLANKGVKTR
jgi:prephenate dehydratase